MGKVLTWEDGSFCNLYLTGFKDTSKALSGWVVNGEYSFRYDKSTGIISFDGGRHSWKELVQPPRILPVEEDSPDYNYVIAKALGETGG